MQNSIQSLARCEKIVNGSLAWMELIKNYAVEQKKLDDFSKQSEAFRMREEVLSGSLEDIEVRLADVSQELHSKTDGNGDEAGSSSLQAVKRAIKLVKDEIQLFDLSAGLISAELLSRKKSNAERVGYKRQARRRGGGAGGKYNLAQGRRGEADEHDELGDYEL